MKKVGNKNLKIIAATSMAIFSLMTTFTAAFAWFTATRERANDADNFVVRDVQGVLKNIYFHEFVSKTIDPNTREATSFTFNSIYSGKISYDWQNKSASYSGNTSVQLDTYSPLNSEHPLLMVMELTEDHEAISDGDIVVTAKTDVEGFLGARNNTGAPVYNLKGNGVYQIVDDDYYFALSSVVDFYSCDTASELYYKNASAENANLINPTYNTSSLWGRKSSIAAKAEDENAIVPDCCFTNIDNSNDTSSFNQTPTIYTSKEGTTIKYVSIIIDYYKDAVEYIYSTYLGNSVLEAEFGYILNYLCDWGLEVL